MLIKTSRLMLILLVIIITSIYLPHFYWMSFSERIRFSYIQYSPVIEKFIIMDHENEKYQDTDGKEYTRDETDELLPLSHYTILLKKGLLPDSIKNTPVSVDDIRINSINFRIRPVDINPPQIQLHPLFESKPERFKLEMPKEFYRITNKMEFINCETNEILEELSNSFTEALVVKGFEFPAKISYGNPTTRKSFDEGYFVIDNKDELYHIKRIKGKPFCNKIEIPQDINIKTIFLREYPLKEFYAFVVTEDHKLYLILFDEYKFQEIPINNYNSDEDVLRFQADIFYRTLVLYKENMLYVYVTDRNYEVIDVYEEKWLSDREGTAGIVSTYIFPFELSVNSYDSKYINFYFSDINYQSIYLNLLMILISMFLMNRKKIEIAKGIIDYVIILLTGIFGFIAVSIFRYED